MKSAIDIIVRGRYSARNMAKPVSFFCAVSEAQSVYVMGDFNDWDPRSHPMARQTDGTWYLQVPLTHGHHLYQFLVDGKPRLDGNATGEAWNERGELVSLMAVS